MKKRYLVLLIISTVFLIVSLAAYIADVSVAVSAGALLDGNNGGTESETTGDETGTSSSPSGDSVGEQIVGAIAEGFGEAIGALFLILLMVIFSGVTTLAALLSWIFSLIVVRKNRVKGKGRVYSIVLLCAGITLCVIGFLPVVIFGIVY